MQDFRSRDIRIIKKGCKNYEKGYQTINEIEHTYVEEKKWTTKMPVLILKQDTNQWN